MRLDPGSLYDYEARAQQVLPHDYWDFIAGGSKDELTTRRNRSAFDAMSLRPRFLRDVTERKLATTVLGTPISFPVMVSPTGGHKLAHPEGECATARGAGMSQTLMMLSTSSHCSLEEVAKVASGPLWFQLYHRGDDVTKMLVQRAEQAGYKAIVLTVDTPLPAPKERDIRNRYANPFPLANFRAMTEDLPAMSGTDEAPNWQPTRVPALTVFRSHSIVKMAERSERKTRSRCPSLTITLSAPTKLSVRSGPVRLQTRSGSPVSRVHCSHSPFGPWKPGAHAAEETSSSAPWAFKLLAIPSEYASAQIRIPTRRKGSARIGATWSPGLDHDSEPIRRVLILRCLPAIVPFAAIAKTVLWSLSD